MASLSKVAGEVFIVHASRTDGARHPVRLGLIGRRAAEQIRGHVTELERSRDAGVEPAPATRAWLEAVSGKLRQRLMRAELCGDGQAATKLTDFIDQYLEQRKDIKPGTMIVMRQAQRHLCRFMGEMLVGRITPADADAYRAHLLSEKRAIATVSKWCYYARHYFTVAQRHKLIHENPFGHIKGGVQGNPARRMFIAAKDVQRVIEVAPDPQWKLLIALARWGGLRIPSEALSLKWGDIDFANRSMTIRASKTEHHADGGIRLVPLFPELAGHLQRVFDEAESGSVYVISRYRDSSVNLRTQLNRYIIAAGLVPWPKPWQNMRATRATELADEFPSHVCAGWLGHTEAVADAHYRMTTDDHFKRAVSGGEKSVAQSVARPANTASYRDSKTAFLTHQSTLDHTVQTPNGSGRIRTRDQGIMSPPL